MFFSFFPLVAASYLVLPTADQPIQYEYDLENKNGKLSVNGTILQRGTNYSPKAAIALLRFRDAHGMELPATGLPVSSKFGCNFIYLPATNGLARFEWDVDVPRKAVKLEVAVSRFRFDWDMLLSDFRCSIDSSALKIANAAVIAGKELTMTASELRQLVNSVVFGPQKKARVEDVRNGIAYGENIALPFDWSCNDFKFKKSGYTVNGFIFLDQVIKLYERTKDRSLLSIVESYTESFIDFINSNSDVDPRTWPWYDDSVARRVQRLSYYYYYFGDQFSRGLKEKLKKSLDFQAEVLMDDRYYRFEHNHGMFQDLGLVIYALLVCDDADHRNTCLDVACGRMKKYFDYIFTQDGVHKEHSPGYEREVQNVIRITGQILELFHPDFSKEMERLAEASSAHLSALTRPDGIVAVIGDSRRLYNSVLPPENVVFPYGGYAVFRSSCSAPPDEATWLLFMAATHTKTHKHSDDLSFLLWHHGNFIVEAGMRNYDYLNAKTAYAYSGYGHNVLCVDDREFPVLIRHSGFREIYPSALRTRITDYCISADRQYVVGRQERFKEVVQDRSISYCKRERVVRVVDELEAKTKLKATLLFHIDPSVDIMKLENDTLEFMRDGKTFSSMKVTSTAKFSLHSYLRTSPPKPYGGLLFENDYGDGEMGSLVMVDVMCKKGKNVVSADFFLK